MVDHPFSPVEMAIYAINWGVPGFYPIFTPKRCAETHSLQVDSSDASSLMRGFRHVLRGLCDGDLLLDRSSCRIVDDASGLERLLKSNKTFGHRVRAVRDG